MSKPQKPSFRQRIAAWLSNGPDTPPDRPEFARLRGLGEIELAFTSGGVDYFKFVNEQHIPALRAFAAKDVWAELSYKITNQHLAASLKSIISLLNQGKGVHAGVITQTLLDRLEWVTNVDLLYKLASVVYFDARENFLGWDPVYNAKKIAAWQADPDLDGFFLKTRMTSYLPFGDLSKIDLSSFTNLQRKSDLSHQKTISSLLSKDSELSDLNTYLASSITTLENLIH